MPNYPPLEIAIARHQQVPRDWMPAAQVRPLILEDPAVVWLQYHGAAYGFLPDTSDYEFGDFIAAKGREFEEKWVQQIAPDAVKVCVASGDARFAHKVEETFELMRQRVPVIAQPALWWAPERIYGVPDLLLHTSWLRDHFPDLQKTETRAAAPYLGESGQDGHYVVFDLKFTTGLDQRRKARDLKTFAAQLRLYTYMLGHLQGLMPQNAFIIARDRVFDPLPIPISSLLGVPLDDDLAMIRDQFIEIKVNGDKYVPWRDEIVAMNLGGGDDGWRTAKETIAREKTPGQDPRLLYYVGVSAKQQLAAMGYPTLDSILREEPGAVPLEDCKGIGGKRTGQIRAILGANRSDLPILPPAELIPPRRPFEFYVDFEYFTNVNVDLEAQWPTLEGCEMIFLIGVGRAEQEDWRFEVFAAEAEDQDRERVLFDEFIAYLQAETDGALFDDTMTALYHWTGAEVWQTRRAADRHGYAENHALRRLPWVDLQKALLDGPGAVPGAWNYSLKEVAQALGQLNPDFATRWPGALDEGLSAMVMGWQAYKTPHPGKSHEMRLLKQYLEADCKALWQILRWLRAGSY